MAFRWLPQTDSLEFCHSWRNSRLIVYLWVTTNTAATDVSAFLTPVSEYGIPSKIRVDRGGENMIVARWMLDHSLLRSDEQCVIAGRSVHNQRIERL